MISGKIIISVVLAYSLAGVAQAACPEDLDGDNQVRVSDLIILLGAWGPNPGHLADFDGDGQVRVPDLIILLAAWGICAQLNDDCETAIPIGLGDTDVDIAEATTGGPTHAGCGFFNGLPRRDLWFSHTAACDGLLCMDTCNQATFDTVMVLYDGCDCPATDEQMLACHDDTEGCFPGNATGLVTAPVSADACYNFRLGSWGDDSIGTTATVSIACLDGVTSNCCYGRHGTGCDDLTCQASICLFDAFCCETDWDLVCVDAALSVCDVCESTDGRRCQ